jgi:hypothetical protein
MYMSEGLWNMAYNEFFEAFRNYQVRQSYHETIVIIIIIIITPSVRIVKY